MKRPTSDGHVGGNGDDRNAPGAEPPDQLAGRVVQRLAADDGQGNLGGRRLQALQCRRQAGRIDDLHLGLQRERGRDQRHFRRVVLDHQYAHPLHPQTIGEPAAPRCQDLFETGGFISFS
jgi:hypothetical protein